MNIKTDQDTDDLGTSGLTVFCDTEENLSKSKEERKLARCHHKSEEVGDVCEILCDDFCSTTVGYCYLIVYEIEQRKQTLHELGRSPILSDFWLHMRNFKTPSFCLLESSDNMLHVSLETGIKNDSMIAQMVCERCGRHGSQPCSYHRLNGKMKCENCKDEITMLIVPTAKNITKKVCGLDLNDLMNLPQDNMKVYQCEAKVNKLLSTVRKDDDIIIRIKDQPDVIFPINSQELRSMRHNYIASEWKTTTDTPLSQIGVQMPEGKLTPDSIDPITKNVLELGSANTPNIRRLTSMFRDKSYKYKDIVEHVGGTLSIIIVGLNHVIANIQMEQEQIQILADRFIEIVGLEMEIVHLCGYDIFRDNNTDD
jgi:hypothetical protein